MTKLSEAAKKLFKPMVKGRAYSYQSIHSLCRLTIPEIDKALQELETMHLVEKTNNIGCYSTWKKLEEKI